MNFEINRFMHRQVESIDRVPARYKNIQIKGAKAHCLKGDFGTLINQHIPSDSWRISMHHFFFNSYTWILYPLEERYPLIMYNYGQELRIYIHMGPSKRVKICGQEFLGSKVFNALTGNFYHAPIACDSGEYHFFSVAGLIHDVGPVLQNPVLGKLIFTELMKTLAGIATQVK
jgi:hypothetical protein